MADVREQILTRVLAIMTATKDADEHVYRNRAELQGPELPAWVLLDGNEEAVVQSSGRRAPPLMVVTPELYYGPSPSENRDNDGIGQIMSARRTKLIRAIYADGPLRDLLGDSGYIEYRGMETDMRIGDEVEGQFRLLFGFAYLFDFDES